MMVKNTTDILKQLRALIKNILYVHEPLKAYIVLSEDAHQNEYSASRDLRRQFLSGFSGSAGTAVVTDNHACLWTDGRYFLQASHELDKNWTLMKEGQPDTPTLAQWLCQVLPVGSKVGFDPLIMTYRQYQTLEDELKKSNHTLVAVEKNLVDLLWNNRPDPPAEKIFPLELNYTGIIGSCKVEKVRSKMAAKGASVFLVTALDEIAWLFNLRGKDIPYNPVFFAYTIITQDEIYLIINENKITPTVNKHLQSQNLNVVFHPYDQMLELFSKILQSNTADHGKIWITLNSSYAFVNLVPKDQLICDYSPIAELKAVKNKTEIEGMCNAHIRDAAALCAYFAWLEKEVNNCNPNLTEIFALQQLEKYRSKQIDFMGLSFETISSSGPNGAIIHYKPQPETDRLITKNDIYLCDSGGQYKDGTTDITRTLHFGKPTDYEKDCFTRVLKGQIQLRTAVFPAYVKGNVLDTLARKFLWDVGLNYFHGTSHGIGAFLNVHEGPMGVSWKVYPDDPGLQEGMFLSNEPGYYEDGKFGIRIENIIRIVPAISKYSMKNTKFLTFEDVAYVPIQTSFIDKSIMTVDEINYLNDYHKKCREKVAPLLQSQGELDGLTWLMKETELI